MESNMKIIIIILFCISFVFAVKPVPRQGNTPEVKKPAANVEVVQNKDQYEKDDKDKNDEKDKQDEFIDNNKNGVNDKREDDVQKIKNTQSKHKDIIKKKKSSSNNTKNTDNNNKKPSTPKTIKKTK